MSNNRLMYDVCAYETRIKESTNPLAYQLNTIKYENCNKCRHELGLVGAQSASLITGNLVDLENDLRGQTRRLSQCPSKQYHPSKNITIQDKCGKKRILNTEKIHLTSCQMIKYKPVPYPKPIIMKTCPPAVFN